MADDKQKNTTTDVKSFDDLKGHITKQKQVDTTQMIKQIVTRDLLERDYKEDLLEVVFTSSPGVSRKIKANRPTQKQMLMIMRLSAEASVYENQNTVKSTEKMTEIYGQLNELAAELCVDKKLDKKFWSEKVSFTTLQNFITALVAKANEGPISGDELDSFRNQ